VTKIKYKQFVKHPPFKYIALNTYVYYSPRYNRTITILKGDMSDGATGAWDIKSDSWWIHDAICQRGTWDDGTKLSNWDASTVLGDILWAEGRKYRAVYWWFMTFFFGGGEARKNGMRRLNK
jgi:hypothetical protein